LRATILAVAPTAPEEATLAFLAWIQSPPGQAIVARRYLPLD
jgi:ABC-type phosphate transport system substrate-binding protein